MTDEVIFATALELPDRAEQAAYLDSTCAGDTQRRRIEMLLAAHQKADHFLEAPVVESLQGPGATRRGGSPPPEEEAEEPIDFLEPPIRADSLGRLGHYEVLQLVGRGGFGIVFRAFDDILQRVVAIKVMSPRMAATSPARKRFLREARGYAAVRHENVVQVHAIEAEPLPYLVMEFIPGESLETLLSAHGPFEATDVVRIGVQVARGLAAAHAQGIIHRDIKPANILIENGPDRRVKITDFGLARTADDASLTQSGMIAGTPMYMAPEQADGKSLDHRADLFSLGSVLYALCTGHPPFRATNSYAILKRVIEDTPRSIRDVIPEIPPALCEIIAKLHAKNPAERIQSASEAADLLSACLTSSQGPALHPSPRQPVASEAKANEESQTPRARREVGRLALVLGVAILGGVAFGVYKLAANTQPQTTQAEPPTLPQPPLPPLPPLPGNSLAPAELLTSPDWEWSTPENLGPGVNGPGRDLAPTLTADELTLIFARDRKLWISQRKSMQEPFGKAELLPDAINEKVREDPSISGDGLVLVFSSERDGKETHVWMCTRKSSNEPFGDPERLPEPVNARPAMAPVLSADGLTLLITSPRWTGTKNASGDILMYTRLSRAEPFGNETRFREPVNSLLHDVGCWVSDDRRVLARMRMGDRWQECRFHVRAAPNVPFGPPQVFGLSPDIEPGRPWLSPDGMRMYFHSREIPGGSGELDLWMVHRVHKKK